MAASNKTVKEVYETVTRYVSDDRIEHLLKDLNFISGNGSFKKTCEMLLEYHKSIKKDKI